MNKEKEKVIIYINIGVNNQCFITDYQQFHCGNIEDAIKILVFFQTLDEKTLNKMLKKFGNVDVWFLPKKGKEIELDDFCTLDIGDTDV